MKLAIVGATGMVGNIMLKVLAERKFPFTELILVASEKSVGKKLLCNEKEYTCVNLQTAVEAKPDIAIFSAGGSTSKEWAPKFSANGTIVIDNSSAWRMEKDVPLVVPEINFDAIENDNKIIANPNCSTIQMVLALSELHKALKIKRLVISTYQSVTGTGVKAVKQMMDERAGNDAEMVYPYQIDLNCLPHAGDFDADAYTSEETKLVNETRKILSDNDIKITATVVRVPVMGGHSMSVNVEFEKDFEMKNIFEILKKTEGITIQDSPEKNEYPMPLYSEHKDDVFVGRIRKDLSQDKSINLWIVADNLRKGAATNAVQIAERYL
ncbi:MAG: aspartate-semialdehyde dehydrogenase [Chitinophagales bacterium]